MLRLVHTALALAVAVPGSWGAAGATEEPFVPPTRIRVLEGRATLVHEGVIERLRTGDRRNHHEAGFLELSTGAEVELRRTGEISLRVTGPAQIEWDASSLEPEEPAEWRVLAVRRLEAEVRRGASRVVLCEQEWTLEASQAAFGLEPALDGSVRVWHHGGASVEVRSRVERGGTWPAELESGKRVSLPALDPKPGS